MMGKVHNNLEMKGVASFCLWKSEENGGGGGQLVEKEVLSRPYICCIIGSIPMSISLYWLIYERK